MLKYLFGLLAVIVTGNKTQCRDVSLVYGSLSGTTTISSRTSNSPNNCISFSVSPGTGCAWMCNYCANQLGTNNYYFTNNVCVYQPGGCEGNPISGVTYSCCSN